MDKEKNQYRLNEEIFLERLKQIQLEYNKRKQKQCDNLVVLAAKKEIKFVTYRT